MVTYLYMLYHFLDFLHILYYIYNPGLFYFPVYCDRSFLGTSYMIFQLNQDISCMYHVHMLQDIKMPRTKEHTILIDLRKSTVIYPPPLANASSSRSVNQIGGSGHVIIRNFIVRLYKVMMRSQSR